MEGASPLIEYRCRVIGGQGIATGRMWRMFQEFAERRQVPLVPGTFNLCADREVALDDGRLSAPRNDPAPIPSYDGAMLSDDDRRGLDAAIAEAEAGRAEGGIPIGSALMVDGEIVGRGHNQRVQRGSVVLHAEMDCLENAGRLPASTYADSTLYTTLSPCDMCTGAALLYGVAKVVIGENTTFMGGEDLLKARGVEVVVVDDERCVQMMSDFIAAGPDLWNEDIGV